MKKDLTKAYIALGVVSFFWGTTYLAARISVADIPGLLVSGVRQFVSGLLMVGYFKMMGYSWPDRKSLYHIAIQGILLLCFSNGLQTWAMEYIPSGLSAIIAALVPVFVTLFSVLLLRYARITKLMAAGLVIGFGGVATIFYEHLAGVFNSQSAFGILLSLSATLTWSFGTVYASRNKPTKDLLFSVGLQMLIAGVVMLFICLVSGKYVNLAESSTASLLSLTYLIVIGSLVTYSAYLFAISKLPPTQVSIYAYINPVVALFLGWLILHEKMSLTVVAGALITLTGVYLVNREFKKQQS
jgi:drug/metabolite transporter (DMT)-like permease